MIRYEELKEEAAKIGFDLCGITPARHLVAHEQRFREWLLASEGEPLAYLTRNISKRFDPTLLYEGAQSVIVCAISYKNGISAGYPAGCRTKIASYACNQDYHRTIKTLLWELLKRLQQQTPTLHGRVFVDSAPLAEKSLAVEAGLGWIGRNSLLINPTLGSFLHLGEVVIDHAADRYDSPYTEDGCGACRRCIEQCPTAALGDKNRLVAINRCIACRTIEQEIDTGGSLDGWLFGCDACQQRCPYNRNAPAARNPFMQPLFDPKTLDRTAWEEMDERSFTERFGATPMSRSGLRRIQQTLRQQKAYETDRNTL